MKGSVPPLEAAEGEVVGEVVLNRCTQNTCAGPALFAIFCIHDWNDNCFTEDFAFSVCVVTVDRWQLHLCAVYARICVAVERHPVIMDFTGAVHSTQVPLHFRPDIPRTGGIASPKPRNLAQLPITCISGLLAARGI